MKYLIVLYLFHFTLVVESNFYPPNGFFSSIDVTSVTWAHAVNSQQALKETLSDPTIRMIEADLVRGRLNTSIMDIAIMAHPPATTSDLSFVSFIEQVIEFNKDKPLEEMKGVKLDFKDYFAAVAAVRTLWTKNLTNGSPIQFPVWINADVVRGPVASESEIQVKGVDLLKLHNASLPNSVLSLGWKTRYGLQSDGEMISEGSYSKADMDEMIQVFRNFTTDWKVIENLPVTYALRAGLAARSLGTIMYLLNSTSHRATVTLWAGADDPPTNLTMLSDLIKVVGKRKMFIDVPFSIKESAAGSLGFNLVFILFSCLMRYLICKLCV